MGIANVRGGQAAGLDVERASPNGGRALIVIGNRSAKNVPNLIGLSGAH